MKGVNPRFELFLLDNRHLSSRSLPCFFDRHYHSEGEADCAHNGEGPPSAWACIGMRKCQPP